MEKIVLIVAIFAITTITCVSIFAIVCIYLRKPMKFEQSSKTNDVSQQLAISIDESDTKKED